MKQGNLVELSCSPYFFYLRMCNVKIYDINQIKEMLSSGKVIYDGESFEIVDNSIRKEDFHKSLVIVLKDLKNK